MPLSAQPTTFLASRQVNLDPSCLSRPCAFLCPPAQEKGQTLRGWCSSRNPQTYFTTGPQETRAWTIKKGAKAPQAAGVIHQDFERGFIRAETIAYADLVAAGSELAAKEAGKARYEGKDYVVKDGDTILFRFNV